MKTKHLRKLAFMAERLRCGSTVSQTSPATLSHEAAGVGIPWNAATTLLIIAVVDTGITNRDQSSLGNSQGRLAKPG